MTDKTMLLKVAGDTTELTTALDQAASSGEASFDRIAKAGEKTGKSISTLGDGAAPAADKLTRAERSMVQSIERTIAAQTAGTKSTSEYYRVLAEQRGLRADVLKPYLDQLDAIPQKQKAAAVATESAAQVANKHTRELVEGTKAYNAALRQVPAQFTDIVVSLQGGQAPMTVLLQQGGQLKDVFGSAGAAARALGGYVAGIVTPFTAAAAAIGVVAYAAYKGAEDIKSFEAALALSGNASGVTTDQLRQLAVSSTASADALAQFARAGVEGASGLKQAAEAAVRFEKYTGIAVKDSVAAWKSLGEEPVKSALKLNDTVSFLTTTIYKQIKALEEQGKTVEAAALAQEHFIRAQNRISDGVEAKLGTVAFGWQQIEASISKAWKALKDFTNGDNVDARIQATQATIAAATKGLQLAQERGETDRVEKYKQILDIEGKRLAMLQNGQSLEKGVSAEKAEQAKRLDAQVAFDKEHDKYLSKSVQMERELATVRENAKNANKGLQAVVDYGGAGAEEARKTLLENQKKLTEAEAGIRKKFAENSTYKPDAWLTDVAKAYTKALDDLDAEQIKASASADKLSKTQEILRRVQSGPEWAAMSFRKKEEIIMAASLAQAEEDRQNAAKAAIDEENKYIASLTESATAQEKKRQSLDDEVKAYKVAIEKNISLAEAIDVVAVARLQDQKAIEMSYGNDKAVEQIDREIKARKELSVLLKDKAAHAAEIELGKASAAAVLAEWKRGWDETDRLAREVFVTWGMDGENMAKKIGDTLKRALLSAVYEATLKPLVFQIYTAIAGEAPGGAVGALKAAGSLGSASSGASSLGSLSSLGSFGLGLQGTIATIAEQGFIGGFSNAMTSAKTLAAAGDFLGAAGSAIPYVGAAVAAISALKSLTSYSITPTGNALTATLSSSGLPTGQVGTRADFTQSSSGFLSGGTTQNSTWGVADANTTSYIQASTLAGTAAVKAYAAALGLSAKDVEGFTKDITVSLTGLDATQAKAAIDKEISGFLDSMVTSAYGATIAAFAKDGETSSATLARLGTELIGVNETFKALGTSLLDTGMAGATAADSLVTLMGGLDTFKTATAAYYKNFYSTAEQKAVTVKQINTALTGTGFDANTATRADFRALVDAQDLTTESGRKMYATLMSVQEAFAGITTAATDSAQALAEAKTKAQDDAMAALKTAIATEKNRLSLMKGVAQESVNTIKGVFDLLHTQVQQLYASVASTQVQGAAQGNAFIDNALSNFKATGYLPDQQQLADAISNARSGLDPQLFKSQFEADQATLIMAGKLSQLEDGSGRQLTTAQQQLADLDRQIKLLEDAQAYWQAQVDELRGIGTSNLTIAEAIVKLQLALAPDASGSGASSTGSGGSSNAAGSDNAVGGFVPATQSKYAQLTYIPDVGMINRTSITDPTAVARLDSINAYINSVGVASVADIQTIAATAQQYGVSQQDIANATGYLLSDIQKLFTGAGVPAFAVGTNYVPKDMLARIHEGEAIVPKAFNPAAGGGMGSRRLEALVESLTEEVQRLQELQSMGNAEARRTADATNGRPEAPTLVTVV